MTFYKIFGTYKGNEEIIDVFEDKDEALKALEEYRIAFGSEWTLRIKVRSVA